MDIESLRTLAKRLQVRLGVLEDVLEQTGIMSEAKRDEMYAKHSAAYDQDEARTLEAARQETLAAEIDWEPDSEKDNGPMSEKVLRAIEELQAEAEADAAKEFNETLTEEDFVAIQVWLSCGCNNCHANVIASLGVSDARQYWDSVADFSIEGQKDSLGNLSNPIDPEAIEEFLSDIEFICTATLPLFNEDDSYLGEPSPYPDGIESFGDGVFSDERGDMGESGESSADALAELLAIIDQPLLLFGSTVDWVNAVREAASKVRGE